MSISARMRHTKAHRCEVCDGADGDPRGKERRCFGWTTEDGEWCHCTRADFAGDIEMGPDDCYAHKMHGPCKCGTQHGEERSGSMPRDEIAALYDYKDEHGAVLYQVVRKVTPGGAKKFVQRKPDGAGGWMWTIAGVRRVPYRLPELLAADPTRVVYIAEGEKDVDTLVGMGEVATCNPMGARKWHFIAAEAEKALKGRTVVILSDADDEGRLHAQDVQQRLKGVVSSVRIVEPPQPYKDVTEYVQDGGDLATLVTEAPTVSIAQDLAPELPFDEIWTDEPDVNLVVPALGIAPGPAHLVTGSWYTGKTLFLATLGLSVASGRRVFGVHQPTRGRWIHFDHEMGRRHLKRYIKRLRAGLGVDPEDLRGHMSLRTLPRLNLCHPGAEDHYVEILRGFSLCTIDPLRAAAPGKDENNSEFRQWIDMLSRVSDRTSCAIVILHHGGKPTEGATRRNTGRGTSAIDDAVQSKWVLTSEEKGAPILVSHEKTRELNQTMEDFYLRIESGPDAVQLVHMEPQQMKQWLAKAAEAKESAQLEKAKIAIRETFAKYAGRIPGPREEALKLVKGVDRNVVSSAFSEMLATGVVKRDGGRGCLSFSMAV